MQFLLAWLMFAQPAVFRGTCVKPVHCETASVQVAGTRATVLFSNGQGFSGERIDGDGPLFVSDAATVDGKPAPAGQGTGCRFYFTDHGTFTPGWESRLVAVECGRINFQVAP